MIKKIPKITSEGVHSLFCKARKFENQLIITIINNNNNDNCNNISININNNNKYNKKFKDYKPLLFLS